MKTPFYPSRRDMSRKNLHSFIRDSLSNCINKNSKVLNIGAGGEIGGIVNSTCSERQADVICIDIDPNRRPDVVCDICEMDFVEEFDVIVCCEVLEHVTRPHIAIERIFNALRRGGWLVMSTPFIFPLHEHPHDYFRYTRFGLQYLCSKFENVEINERNGWAEAVCVLWSRFKFDWRGQNPLVAVMMFAAACCYPLATLFSKLLPSREFTTGYTLLAKKPELTNDFDIK
jgi:SAM-dependent methyltransferase